jgi:O-antigen/teichoic acid export membrane protein
MILVNGFDLILVGRFQFSAVTPYAVSATFIMFMAGLQSAIFGVIMPHAAGLQAQEKSKELGNLLISATKIGVLLLLLTGLPLITFAHSIIGLWIGKQFAQTGGPILTVLMIANMLRLMGAPYASILIGTGQQRLVIVSPFMEGVTNLFFSLLLGYKYGAIGVAWGTFIGAVVGMLANVFYNLPRTRNYIEVTPYRFVRDALASPAFIIVPAIVAWLVAVLCNLDVHRVVRAGLIVSYAICVILVIRNISRQVGLRSMIQGGVATLRAKAGGS